MVRRFVLIGFLVGCMSPDDGPRDGAAEDGAVDDGAAEDGALDAGVDGGTDASVDAGVDGGTTDASVDAGEAGLCVDGVGFREPLATCSASDPCTRPLLGIGGPIDEPIERARCRTSLGAIGDGRPRFDDGVARTMMVDGVARAWCEGRPAGATGALPLVITIPASGSSTQDIYDHTNLRSQAESYPLADGGGPDGFVFVVVQPRNLHWPTASDQDGPKHDTFHRDLGSPSTNPDIAFVDALIDRLDDGSVDPRRVYLMGHSNGGRFTALYGLARHLTPTPGGNRVAAVANYSAGDPFATHDPASPECAMVAPPRVGLPIQIVSRDCDEVACDSATAGDIPGNIVSPWVERLRSEIGAAVEWRIIDGSGTEVFACAAAGCRGALLNHLRWPDGVNDEGGAPGDWEPRMLAFLADHPLP